MKKGILAIAVVLVVVAMAGSAMAATDTAGFTVTATAAKSCSISGATDVVFATAYDPTSGTDNDSGSGTATFRCTKNTAWNANITGTRSMTGATNGDTLNFELYTTAGRTTAFPAVAGATVSGTAGSKNTDITVNYFGRILNGQDVSAPDNYSTAVGGMVFTVNY